MARAVTKANKGRITLIKLMPADFIAANSLFSPRVPNTITELSKTAKGKAIGTKVALV